ncbi:hypothetical protein BD311DRAFT_167213 [Dichomitus squalens]|uniref:Uncharacterized protein n=1 Tax=Dichomitus squalens TaxID=114155 RepID=A0A4Q9M887_9APHY|nr:hypothetical protein BD311DRAFT_167213 [Dichomitus squalens]
MQSVDVWAGALIQSLYKKAPLKSLDREIGSYRDFMKLKDCHNRLLLALAAATAYSPPGSNADHSALELLEKFFELRLEVMPWKVVHHVAAAVYMRLHQLLVYPSDSEVARDTNRITVGQWLSILIRCCFAPVSVRERSQEEREALIWCIFGKDFLWKSSVPTNGDFQVGYTQFTLMLLDVLYLMFECLEEWTDTRTVLTNLMLVHTYLDDSEDSRNRVPGRLLAPTDADHLSSIR